MQRYPILLVMYLRGTIALPPDYPHGGTGNTALHSIALHYFCGNVYCIDITLILYRCLLPLNYPCIDVLQVWYMPGDL